MESDIENPVGKFYRRLKKIGDAGSSRLINRLQLLARLEAHSLARRDRNLSACPGIASNARFPWPHIKHSESTQFDAVAFCQRSFHAFKDSFDRQFGFGFGDSSLVYHFIDDVELYHKRLPAAR
jgi:hypothetical protein